MYSPYGRSANEVSILIEFLLQETIKQLAIPFDAEGYN